MWHHHVKLVTIRPLSPSVLLLVQHDIKLYSRWFDSSQYGRYLVGYNWICSYRRKSSVYPMLCAYFCPGYINSFCYRLVWSIYHIRLYHSRVILWDVVRIDRTLSQRTQQITKCLGIIRDMYYPCDRWMHIRICVHEHTHTHTYIYIYIYKCT